MIESVSADEPRTALVLGGGGARGAYEAGVVLGIIEVLNLGSGDPAPFHIFTGTSAGALNGTFLAAHVDRGNLAVADLARHWSRLEMREFFRIPSWALIRRLRNGLWADSETGGDDQSLALVDPKGLEGLLQSIIPWARLRRNFEHGRLRALAISALDVYSARICVFLQLAAGARFHAPEQGRFRVQEAEIEPDIVLASAAIPLLFPARRIGDRYYSDCSLRFNTPIAPAIRGGADRLVVISPRHPPADESPPAVGVPRLPFMLGRLLNVALFDAVSQDLRTLNRINRLVDIFDRRLSAEARGEVDEQVRTLRGAPYRPVEPLVFMPSREPALLAQQPAQRCLEQFPAGQPERWLLQLAVRASSGAGSDFSSYVLFDGRYTSRLVELGRDDAHARAEDIRRFFQA